MALDCPKCNSNDIQEFERFIYIVDGKDFHKKRLFGCLACQQLFVIMDSEKPVAAKKRGINDIFKAAGQMSKNVEKMFGTNPLDK